MFNPFLVCPAVLLLLMMLTIHGTCLMDPNILLTLPHHHLPRYHHSHWTGKKTEAGWEWGIGLPSCMACGWPRRRGLSPDLAAAHLHHGASTVAQCKEAAYNVGDSGSIPGLGRSLEEGTATHSSILAWRIPWTEEPGGLECMVWQRVRCHCRD